MNTNDIKHDKKALKKWYISLRKRRNAFLITPVVTAKESKEAREILWKLKESEWLFFTFFYTENFMVKSLEIKSTYLTWLVTVKPETLILKWRFSDSYSLIEKVENSYIVDFSMPIKPIVTYGKKDILNTAFKLKQHRLHVENQMFHAVQDILKNA